jgi:hypothetical protein
MQVRADVNQAGSIIINASTPGGGWLKEYAFTSAESMHSKAKGHDWVTRPNGKTIKGADYTLKMAKNDFSKVAK